MNRVVAARVTVALDPGGLDVDREIEADAMDAGGQVVTGVDVEPRTVHVTIPLFTNKESRTLPVNPIVTGTPAPGFRIASIEVDPLVALVEGDGEQLTALTRVDTAPIAVFGATSDVSQVVTLALPTGVVATGPATVTVTVHVEAVTETRTYVAGLRLDGRDPALDYAFSPTTVVLTLFGSVADLDLLGPHRWSSGSTSPPGPRHACGARRAVAARGRLAGRPVSPDGRGGDHRSRHADAGPVIITRSVGRPVGRALTAAPQPDPSGPPHLNPDPMQQGAA